MSCYVRLSRDFRRPNGLNTNPKRALTVQSLNLGEAWSPNYSSLFQLYGNTWSRVLKLVPHTFIFNLVDFIIRRSSSLRQGFAKILEWIEIDWNSNRTSFWLKSEEVLFNFCPCWLLVTWDDSLWDDQPSVGGSNSMPFIVTNQLRGSTHLGVGSSCSNAVGRTPRN